MIKFRDRNEEPKDEPMDEHEEPDVVEKVIGSMPQVGLSPSEIQRIKDNRKFVRDITNHPVKKDHENIKVFGVKDVNINAILKDNIWNRGIFTTDHLCRVAFGMTLEQLRKYLGQKRKKPFEHWMLILIIIGVAIALVVILVLMNTKIDFGKIFG